MNLKSKTLSHAVVSALGAAFVFAASPTMADEYVDIGVLKFTESDEVAVAVASNTASKATMAPVTSKAPVSKATMKPIVIETASKVELSPSESTSIVYTKSLQSRVEAFRKAMVEADIDVLDALADENLSFGHSNGVIQTKQDFIDMVRNGDEVFLTLDLSEKEVKQAGDLSIERHIFTSDIVIGGETISVKLNILEVWRDGPKGWRLFARQAYKV